MSDTPTTRDTWDYLKVAKDRHGNAVTKTSPEVALWLLLDLDERLRKIEEENTGLYPTVKMGFPE